MRWNDSQNEVLLTWAPRCSAQSIWIICGLVNTPCVEYNRHRKKPSAYYLWGYRCTSSFTYYRYFGGAGVQADMRTPQLHTRSTELNPKQVGSREIICFHPSPAAGWWCQVDANASLVQRSSLCCITSLRKWHWSHMTSRVPAAQERSFNSSASFFPGTEMAHAAADGVSFGFSRLPWHIMPD